MLGDNETNLILTKDPKSQNRTKHINVIHYYICRLVENEELAIEWIESSAIFTNRLTKSFFIGLFKKY